MELLISLIHFITAETDDIQQHGYVFLIKYFFLCQRMSTEFLRLFLLFNRLLPILCRINISTSMITVNNNRKILEEQL